MTFASRYRYHLFRSPPVSSQVRGLIAAGALDEPTGLRVVAHVYTSQAGDYYELADDDLLRFPPPGRSSALDADAVLTLRGHSGTLAQATSVSGSSNQGLQVLIWLAPVAARVSFARIW
jgi:hypothetical protein